MSPGERLNRRAALGTLTGGAAVSTLAALAACVPTPLGGQSNAPTSAPTSAAGALPSYFPQANGPSPDFPAPGPLYEDGFTYYPSNPPRALPATPPGSGGVVHVYTSAGAPIPPTPLDQNPAWQAMNRQLNADVQFTIISQADYQAKFTTVIAGGDLPDILLVAFTPNLTRFLETAAADLTPYLQGDAVRDYPNLAALPTYAWKNSGCARNGHLYMIPIQRYATGYTLWRSKFDYDRDIGPDYTPTNADDFRRVLLQLNRPNQNHWAMGGYVGQAYYLNLYLAMFGVPNNWSLDSSGKLLKDYETPQFREAVDYVRDLVAAGVYHPDALSIPDPNTSRLKFLNREVSLILELFGVGWQDAWTRGLKQNPVFIPAPLNPFPAHDGQKPQHYLRAGYANTIMFKKASEDRIKELLRIANWVAAPFGSQEDLLMTTGVVAHDYTLDDAGRPVPTESSNADANSVPWKYVTQHPQVAWLTGVPDYARAATDFEKIVIPMGVTDPTWGYVSPTNDDKATPLARTFLDGVTDILAGRRPLTDLDQLVGDWRSTGGDQIRDEYLHAMSAA